LWFDDIRKWGRADLNCLLGEPIEQFAPGGGLPAIEAKGELGEIGIEVSIGNGPLVSSQEPSLQAETPPDEHEGVDVHLEPLAFGSVVHDDIPQVGGKR
jgi:hypothetical protein